MLIECTYCEATVDGKMIGQHESSPDEDFHMVSMTSLLGCPACGGPVLVIREQWPGDDEWSSPITVYPAPNQLSLSLDIPALIRNSLEEAFGCLKGKTWHASAVMSGRAMEAICRHFETKSGYLGLGLRELLDRQIIDQRLFEWSEQLRKHRNIGAHASDESISDADAKDLFDFAQAICNYVFVLNKQFEDFIKRKNKRNP